MNYSNFKNKQKIMVYIPLTKRFHNAEVIETVDGDFTLAFTKPIQGHHDVIKRISTQEQLDKWFYVDFRKKITNQLFDAAESKFKVNGKEWIFENKAFAYSRIIN